MGAWDRSQFIYQLIRRARTLLAFLFEAVENESVHFHWKALDGSRRRHGRVMDVFDENFHRGLAFEDASSGEKPEGHASQCVDVGPRIDLVDQALGELGGGEVRRSGKGTHLGHSGVSQVLLHHAEIQDFHEVHFSAVATQIYVGGLDIPVDHARLVGFP